MGAAERAIRLACQLGPRTFAFSAANSASDRSSIEQIGELLEPVEGVSSLPAAGLPNQRVKRQAALRATAAEPNLSCDRVRPRRVRIAG